MQKEKSILSYLAEFANPYKKLYITSVILAICGVACSLVPYFIMGDVVSKLIAGVKEFHVYLKDGLIMSIFWLGKVVFHSLSTSSSHKATFQVLGNMRKLVCQKLSQVPLGKVKDMPTGSLKNIIVERIDSIETTLAHVLPEFTANLLAPFIVFIYLLFIDWRMALVSLISLPLGLICYMEMMIGYEKSFKNTVEKTKILNNTAVEYINGIEVIKAFGKAQNSYEKFKIAAKEGADCYIEWMRRCNVFFSIAMVLAPCTTISVLPIGAYFMMNGSLSLPHFILCLILSLGLIAPLITVMSYSDDIGKMKTIVGEVVDVLKWQDIDRPLKQTQKIQNYDIELKNVYFAYHEQEVLHGINMSIKEGSVTALVGPSGSGKSTIAKLIASLWDVKSGSISVGNININEIPLDYYNQQIAYVSQDNYLFDTTIRENIRMGKANASDLEVEEVAKKSGCHDFIMQLENGYETIVGGAGGHLSGGERQRIAIARAMLKNAPIVILDEATAYTDPENEALIQASVAQLVAGKTLIVIAHRLSTIADADQIYVIDDGQVIETGTHQALLNKQGLYAKMWASHISVKDVKKGEIIHA